MYPGDWMLHCHLPHHNMNQMVSMVGPMAHVGQGMHTGMGMEEGMGIVRDGNALSENLGPSLGRTIGGGSDFEKPVTHAPLGSAGHAGHAASVSGQDPYAVPGFPQDMWMVEDDKYRTPETYGLRAGWTGGMMGMMTLVRVLEPGLWDRIQALRAERAAGRMS